MKLPKLLIVEWAALIVALIAITLFVYTAVTG